MKIPYAKDIKKIDYLALKKYNIPGIILMENAGRASAEIIQKYFGSLENKKIVVFAGHGNNGGDGLCLARHLSFISNAQVKILLLSGPDKFKNEAKINLDILQKSGFNITPLTGKNIFIIKKYLQACDLIIDAIFGTGFHGTMPDFHQKVIGLINKSNKPVISLDIPSGVNSDTGQIESEAVKADLTITMELPKPGLFIPPAIDFVGKLEIAKLGYPPELIKKAKTDIHFLQKEDVHLILPVWPKSTHKGSRGKILVIAGSKNYIGAPFLSSQSALKSGAGLVNLVIPESIYPSLSKRITEIILHPLPETKNKSLSLNTQEKILELSEKSDAVLLGPGISQENETKILIKNLIQQIKKPLIIDADGLNALSEDISILKTRKYPTILTPHPGEMSHLIKTFISDVQKNRINIARDFAKKHKIFLVLKGAYSIIALPNGEIFINSTGNPGMAQAGMGDVLAGMIASFLGQNIAPDNALKLACILHGKTGDILAEKKGQTGFSATDVVNHLFEAVKAMKYPTNGISNQTIK